MALIDPDALSTAMERSGMDAFLAGTRLARGPVRTNLLLDPAGLDRISLQLGQIARRLPCGRMDPYYKAIHARERQPGRLGLVRNTADALLLCPEVADKTGLTPPEMGEMAEREGTYDGFNLIGDQVSDQGIDLRLLTGAFLRTLIDQVLGKLAKRFADPALTRTEEEALLDAFGPALLILDEALRRPVERKEELSARRAALAAEARSAQADAALLETTQAVERNLTVSQEALLQAARRHMERKNAGPAR